MTTKVRTGMLSEVTGQTPRLPSACCPFLFSAPDPTFEFVHRFTVWVPLTWTSSWNVKLILANDTSFVERLLGENVSTRSVGCERSACTAPTRQADVLPETPNMFTIAVLGTSSSKRWLVTSAEPVRRYAVARSQASSDQSQMPNLRTMLREIDMLACLLFGTFSSLTTDTKLSGRPSSWQDCFSSSELSCLVPSKIPPVPSSFSELVPC